MGTTRALGHGGHAIAAENMGDMPEMEPVAMAGIEGMASGPGATAPQIVAMTVLTLIALAGGIIVATVYGRWAM